MRHTSRFQLLKHTSNDKLNRHKFMCTTQWRRFGRRCCHLALTFPCINSSTLHILLYVAIGIAQWSHELRTRTVRYRSLSSWNWRECATSGIQMVVASSVVWWGWLRGPTGSPTISGNRQRNELESEKTSNGSRFPRIQVVCLHFLLLSRSISCKRISRYFPEPTDFYSKTKK